MSYTLHLVPLDCEKVLDGQQYIKVFCISEYWQSCGFTRIRAKEVLTHNVTPMLLVYSLLPTADITALILQHTAESVDIDECTYDVSVKLRRFIELD